MPQKLKGFTLIELIIVIAIIAILAAIVIVAVNPLRQFSQARNTARRNDVNAILNSISQYAADANNGILPSTITTTPTNICTKISGGAETCTGLVDLSVVAPTYVSKIPRDPQPPANNEDTGYRVAKDASERITVDAPSAELGTAISVTR